MLATTIGMLRFCGSVSLPPKPPPPAVPTGTARQNLTKATQQTPVYQQGLEQDASGGSFNVPTLEDMGRKLPYRGDEKTIVLAFDTPVDAAGLRLKLVQAGDSAQLEIENLTGVDVAYEVTTETNAGAMCNSARPLPFDAMVLHKATKETRVECVYRPDMTIRVTRAETLELQPLMAYYIDHVPPTLVGIDDRIARGHHVPWAQCSSAISQAVRSGVENKEIRWRDLIDFYARHNCQRYQFPVSYRAFSEDGERSLPAI